MTPDIEKTLMAVLFAAAEPIAPEKIAAALELDAPDVDRIIKHMADKLDSEDYPLQILDLAGQYQLTTREIYTPDIRKVMNEKRNTPLSQAALEVLAAVAYNQPVTRAYVEQVRGVDSSSVVTTLVEKGLLEEAGRLELPGRPIAYRTTALFLRTFGLSSLEDLPVSDEPEFDEEELSEIGEDDVLDGQITF
ncbi:MAG: SMC-Scp complex subunit ScpB [Oscillospiraceae bacterium]|nr:SMC-Scp complex subunit ScpB [Oscillospiraceae bacterium]